jgi:nucleoside-diphosphate-sugar epimerase
MPDPADGPILITGGTGFIGSYVARALLDRGQEVCLYDLRGLSAEARFVLGEAADGVVVDEGGVENWPRLLEVVRQRRPGAIVHIAAITNPVFLATNPHPAAQVNFGGTLNVLEAARLFDVGRVIAYSSIGVLPAVRYQPIDANHPVILAGEGPGSGFYGAAKAACEAFGFAYVQGFGLDVRIVRPSAVYGFGMQWPIYVKPMVEGAVRGEPVRFDAGGPFPRDYTHVADVASLTVALLDGPAEADRVFYAATGEPLVTAARVAELVRELVPGADIEIADALGPNDHLELRYRGVISIANAREQLGWTPLYADIRAGLAEYVERYRAFLAYEGLGARG